MQRSVVQALNDPQVQSALVQAAQETGSLGAWDGNDFQKQSEAKYMGVSINGGIQKYCWFISWTIQSKWMIWG